MESETPRTLQTVESTCRVLVALQEFDGAGVTELANHLDVSKGAAYNHLVTLKETGFVVQEEGTYRLSYRFLNFGRYVQQQSPLYRAGREEINKLAEETGEHVHLMTEENGFGVYLHRAQGENAIAREYHAQKNEHPDYLHHSSTGKAVLAYLPHKRVEKILDEHGLPKYTDKTVTSRQTLFEELETIQERGYAVNDEEEIPGTRAIGVPIMDSDDEVLGAVSVSGPLTRMQGSRFDEELPEKIQRTANLIEINLQTQDAAQV